MRVVVAPVHLDHLVHFVFGLVVVVLVITGGADGTGQEADDEDESAKQARAAKAKLHRYPFPYGREIPGRSCNKSPPSTARIGSRAITPSRAGSPGRTVPPLSLSESRGSHRRALLGAGALSPIGEA